MTEGYGEGQRLTAWNMPAVAQLEQRIVAIEQLLVALHASFERIEAGMAHLLTEIQELG